MLRLISNPSPQAPSPGRTDELGQLRTAAVSGDKRALRTLLLQITPPVLHVVRRVLGPDHIDVEDVAQESVCHFVERLADFRGECTTLHFACRIGVFTAMNARRRAHSKLRAGFETDEGLECSGPSPEEQAAQDKLAVEVRALVDRLPEALASSFLLHVVLGYTTGEVAEAEGIPLETAKSRLRLARQALRRRLMANAALREATEHLR
jgi:RNA polymerase sigma factor (sigma-70 family)